jgi:serine protease Do
VTGTSGTNFFGQPVMTASAGSGFVLTRDGYIVTNYHVVKNAETVKVTMYNGDELEAKYVGGDEDYDIAVIKVEATNLQPVTLGDSDTLNVGDHVLAIGNPLGELTFSMSGGMVSSVNRAINVDGTPFNMIQTDASINSGNSGGPLFNQYGEVVGIVSAKYSSSGSGASVEGLGFAIPINDVFAMIEDIMTNGFVTNKPYLGINGGTLTEQMADQYRFDVTSGVFVYSVEKDSAAEKAALQMGDVILKVDEHEVESLEDLNAVKKKYAAGDTVTLTVYRSGEEIEVELTFDAVPADQQATEQEQQPQSGQQYGNQYGNPFNPFEDFFRYFYGY